MRFRVASLNLRLVLVSGSGRSAAAAVTLAIHLGGRPRRFPMWPEASRSTVKIASSIRCLTARSSARIL